MSTQQVKKVPATVIALASEKGGVGKTTLTAIFLAMLSMLGYRVLGIDMDPQGHLGLIYAYHRDTLLEGIYDILLKYVPNVLRERAPARRIIKKTYYDQTGRIFDPRKPDNDTLDVVLRKIYSRNQLEEIVQSQTQGLLQGLLSPHTEEQNDEATTAEKSKYYATTIWYGIQQQINETILLGQEQGIEGDQIRGQINELILKATHGRYTLEVWEETQKNIDEAVWGMLQERISVANPGPDIIPITASAGNADHMLKDQHQYWGEQLRQAIHPLLSQYDYILIDCPPSIQVLTINALNASNYVAIPLTPETLNIEGMVGLLGVIDQAQTRANPGLQTAGIVLNKVQPTWKIHQDGARDVRSWENRERVFDTIIKQNSAVVTSLGNQSLIVLDQGESEYAKAYWLLLQELLSVIGGPAVDDVSSVIADIKQQEIERKKTAEERKQQPKKLKKSSSSTRATTVQ